MNYKILKFKIMGDNRGSLISLEQLKNIPFKIKRVYYIFDTKTDIVRGKHAHTKLQQVAICVNGSCNFLLDNGKDKKNIKLNSPDVGLFIGKNMWREMYDFSSNCVLVVLANEYYDEKEYIRNYQKFIEIIKNKQKLISKKF